jgi:hypothetical protein
VELKAELHKYLAMDDVPRITAPIESDAQYILVVRFSEVIILFNNKFGTKLMTINALSRRIIQAKNFKRAIRLEN